MKQSQTRIFSFLSAILFIFALISIVPTAKALAAQASPTPQLDLQTQSACNSGRSVQVSGTAVVNVTPDRVLIQLGVQSNGSTPGEVAAVNSLAIQKVTEALRLSGIQAKDIATDWYVIEPVYENYDSLYIKGYRINNVMAITLRDVSKTSSIIAAALQAGANQIINVEFYTSEMRKYRDQAREMAMIAATEKGQALAAAANAETGCVLSINESSSSSYYGGWYGGRDRNLWMQNSVQNVAAPTTTRANDETGPVSLGQISVLAEVGVSFSLK